MFTKEVTLVISAIIIIIIAVGIIVYIVCCPCFVTVNVQTLMLPQIREQCNLIARQFYIFFICQLLSIGAKNSVD